MLVDLEAARARLAGAALGAPLVVLAETSSTNDDAKRGAKEGAPHGATWVADAQTHGRGRQGRAWTAAPGDALLVSVLLRLACPPSRLPLLALAAGLAARDALAVFAPDAALLLKWPNDVVAPSSGVDATWRKLAGILVESTIAGTSAAIIVGIGANVGTRAFPPELAPRATSLAQLGDPPSRADVLVELLSRLDATVPLVAARGLAPVHARLTAADALRGRAVRSDGGEEGVARGIDAEGRLEVITADGRTLRWSAGEVHLVVEPGAGVRRSC